MGSIGSEDSRFAKVRQVLFCFLLLVGVSGCASLKLETAESSSRRGFFDLLAELEPGNRRHLPRNESGRGDGREGNSKQALLIANSDHLHGVGGLQWPLRSVTVTSDYGKRGRHDHEGVDLKASVGTPVYAAQSGKVLYAGNRISGYGKMIVLRHASGLATIYAHASKLLVKRGQRVLQRQMIALSGQTGRARGPHLHFEIRKGLQALNPFKLLPSSAPKSVAMK